MHVDVHVHMHAHMHMHVDLHVQVHVVVHVHMYEHMHLHVHVHVHVHVHLHMHEHICRGKFNFARGVTTIARTAMRTIGVRPTTKYDGLLRSPIFSIMRALSRRDACLPLSLSDDSPRLDLLLFVLSSFVFAMFVLIDYHLFFL